MSHGFQYYKIKGIFLKLKWANRQNDWINIKLCNSKSTNIHSAKYVVTQHELNFELSHVMLTVHRSMYMVGTDKLLSINSKMMKDQSVTCNIQIESQIKVIRPSNKVKYIGRFCGLSNVVLYSEVVR